MKFEVIKAVKKTIKKGLSNTKSKTDAKIVYIDGDYKVKIKNEVFDIENNKLEDFTRKNVHIYPSRINNYYYDLTKDNEDTIKHKIIFDYNNFNNKSNYAKKVVNKYWKPYYAGQRVLTFKFVEDTNKVFIIKLSKRWTI
jgi:hypothetical protein